MIPLYHDLSGETVLVVGGGRVGARKARRFAREARTIVVSPAFAEASFGDAELVRAALEPESVAGWLDRIEPALVVAATDHEALNEALAAGARDRGLLLNRADRAGADRGAGGVAVPATVREEPVVVAIGTGGSAPALSKELRRRIEGEIEGAGAMAEVVSALRAELKRRGADPERRREVVATVAGSEAVWTTLRTGDPNPEQVIEDVFDRLEAGEEPA